jgi:hypothetical protein
MGVRVVSGEPMKKPYFLARLQTLLPPCIHASYKSSYLHTSYLHASCRMANCIGHFNYQYFFLYLFYMWVTR